MLASGSGEYTGATHLVALLLAGQRALELCPLLGEGLKVPRLLKHKVLQHGGAFERQVVFAGQPVLQRLAALCRMLPRLGVHGLQLLHVGSLDLPKGRQYILSAVLSCG